MLKKCYPDVPSIAATFSISMIPTKPFHNTPADQFWLTFGGTAEDNA